MFAFITSCGRPTTRSARVRHPESCILEYTQGPSWWYLKVNYSETLSIFGDKCPRNGSKNEEMAPRTKTGYPHIGPFEGGCTAYTSPLPLLRGLVWLPHQPGGTSTPALKHITSQGVLGTPDHAVGHFGNTLCCRYTPKPRHPNHKPNTKLLQRYSPTSSQTYHILARFWEHPDLSQGTPPDPQNPNLKPNTSIR